MATLKDYPLGECEVKYTLDGESDAVILGLTLKESDAVFTNTFDIFKVEMDQMEGPYKSKVIPSETTFKCSIWLNEDIVTKLSNVYEKGATGTAFSTAGKEMKFGKLEIHPLSAGTSKEYDIIGPRVFCKMDTNISFKKDGQAKCDLTFEFSSDENPDSETYRKLFTIGKYTKPSGIGG
ncbi:hypothetical protein F350042L8_00160 [Fusobacterium ulcerans]|uniref:Uncharacterized protein n=1 Tax=Fusobacterium ulcerans 12-1B TaxID=457404 RepID=H1PNU2_9FUSO|nr:MULTISPECIES: hypothetical protein [Fusobacterium]EHO85161.1 hypothetical protein HMPREF0402_00085 [Fusobacterium ulcerans 12-1B]UYI78836.1 MAG: hypothetical protein OGM09_01035 [Fusobacterium varium]